MKNIVFFLVSIMPFYGFSQKKYQKNKHVDIVLKESNKEYDIHYTFKDHLNQIHDLILSFEKDEFDKDVSKFGVPKCQYSNIEQKTSQNQTLNSN